MLALRLGTEDLRALGLGDLDGQDRPAAARTGSGHRFVPGGVIALGVGGAGEEDLALAGFFLQQCALAALGTGHPRVLGAFQGLDVSALGIAGAADELAVLAALDLQGGAAVGAGAPLHQFRGGGFLALGLRQVPGVIALGILGAADEATVAAQANREGGAALGAGLVQGLLGNVAALDVLLDVIDALLEGLPELLQQWHPLLLAAGDGVEFVLQSGGEVVVDVGGEVLGEEAVDHPSHVRGQETLLVEDHVFPLLEGGDDAGVG